MGIPSYKSTEETKGKIIIPDGTRVLFVNDMFIEDHPQGGAELTSQSLVDSCPYPIMKIHSGDLTPEFVKQCTQYYWVLGNFFSCPPEVLVELILHHRYSVIEYDYKYCLFRSPQKHLSMKQEPCDCDKGPLAELVSEFYAAAQTLWWMSEKQYRHHLGLLPLVARTKNLVLSSVFDHATLARLQELRYKYQNRTKWIVLDSPSWVKGAEQAEEFCKANGLEYEKVWDLSYNDVLEKLASARGLVYLPNGFDTCPRMVIEAKLLGCQLHLNEYVQHATEHWFNTNDLTKIESYLALAHLHFWNVTDQDMSRGRVLTERVLEERT